MYCISYCFTNHLISISNIPTDTDGKKGSTYCYTKTAKCNCNIGRFYSPTYPFAPLVLQTLGQCCQFATDCEAELYCCPSIYKANEAGIFKAINPNTCVESSQDCVGITNSPSTSVSPTESPTDSCSFGDNGSVSRYGECNNDLCCQGCECFVFLNFPNTFNCSFHMSR